MPQNYSPPLLVVILYEKRLSPSPCSERRKAPALSPANSSMKSPHLRSKLHAQSKSI